MKTPRTLLAALVLALPILTHASSTEVFVHDTAVDFADGDLTTATLTLDGSLLPPPKRRFLGHLDAEIVWDIQEVEGTRYVATGNGGKLFSVAANGRLSLVHDFGEPSLFALAPGAHGSLLIGASPGGTVHRLAEGRATVHARVGEEFIWDLEPAGSEVITATGPRGRIVRILDDGSTALLATVPSAEHILDLHPVPGSTDMLFGTRSPGLVGRATLGGRISILLDCGAEEVRRVALLPDGSIIAAANGAPATLAPAAKASTSSSVPGRLHLIRPSGFSEVLWTAPEGSIHDIFVQDDGRLIVASGTEGAIFRIDRQGRADRVGLTTEALVTRFAPLGEDRFHLGTGKRAALFEVDLTKRQGGTFVSPVIDAGNPVAWTRISALMDEGDGSARFAWRSGNTSKPDAGWTAWNQPSSMDEGSLPVSGHTSRFFQYRVDLVPFEGLRPIPPRIDRVEVYASRPNIRPTVGEITIGARATAGKAPQHQHSPSASEIPLSWIATDPNGDQLTFDLYLREQDDTQWVPLHMGWREASYTLDSSGLADGVYRLRVVANDAASNSPGEARTDERTSAPFLIDKTAPQLTVQTVQRSARDRVLLTILAHDTASRITSLKWRPLMTTWNFLSPADGVYDEDSELFHLAVEGELAEIGSFVTIVATDAAGNSAVEKVRLD